MEEIINFTKQSMKMSGDTRTKVKQLIFFYSYKLQVN